MRILIILLIAVMLTGSANSQLFDKLKKSAEKLVDTKKTGNPFSSEEAAKAIKEALVNGTSKGTDFISKADGFYKNPEIKIWVFYFNI